MWWKIRTVGVDAHPFLAPTMNDAQTGDAMTEAAKRIVTDAALEIASVECVTEIGVIQQ